MENARKGEDLVAQSIEQAKKLSKINWIVAQSCDKSQALN